MTAITDWFPFYNSLRVACVATILVFFTGIFAAHIATKLSGGIKTVLDVVFTLPLVLPPTVVGYFLLCFFGANGMIGGGLLRALDIQLVMTWYVEVLASAVVAFPLMYRTARGAFESMDKTLVFAAQTLGMGNNSIFWRVILPTCKPGIVAGSVLAFARALGEYGATAMVAGYIPGKTATISTTVYQLWRTGDDGMAFRWVMLNLGISAIILALLNYWERRR